MLIFLSFNQRVCATELNGTVRDSATLEPLSDVIITVQGTNSLVFTDALGRFHIADLQNGSASLRITRIGYQSQVITRELTEGNNEMTLFLVKGSIQLNEVAIHSSQDIGTTLSTINQVDRVMRPTNSAQDLLRLVPGLFIAQHAGGGKAEQIFLRGFDVDHGTDFSISIDGIPVNMVSHAHGQGYADFHFVIPETVDKLQVNKGPYSAQQGDFATAGSGDFFTKNTLQHNMIKIEGGRFDTYRAVGMFRLPQRRLLTGNNEQGYIAAEYNFTNSWFESPQDFHRYNFFAKYSTGIGTHSQVTFSFSTFRSRWDASGQIPDRAVTSELIDRFGAIDNTEGGSTSRTNGNIQFITSGKNGGLLKNQLFYSHYTFDLYSNFTFFLNDTVNGDQIRQTENGRNIYGYAGSYDKTLYLERVTIRSVAGVGTRIDNGVISLMRSQLRAVRDTVASGELYEQNINAFLEETVVLSPKFTVNAGVRYDYFIFSYNNHLTDSAEGTRTRSRISPKMSFYFTPNDHVQLYVKSGFGFHSNDARSVVSGAAGNSLPRAFGYEAGSTFRIGRKALINISLWGLDLENELVYVGDEGIVEISGATRRLGIDFSARYEMTSRLFADVDFNYNYGRYRYLPKGENYIPLAPAFTSTGGLTWKHTKGWSASLRYRFIDTRPANENNTVQALGYFLLDAVVSYSIKQFTFTLTGENLLNARWNEAQFDTESRLRGETQSVSELHYTPGSPLFVKGSIAVSF